MLWENEPQANVSTAFSSSPKLSAERVNRRSITPILLLSVLIDNYEIYYLNL